MSAGASYSASLATDTYTSSSFVVTRTFSLDPQTTPFTIPSAVAASGVCSGALYCDYRADEIKPGSLCWHFDQVNETFIGQLNEQCYPRGYRDIFRQGDSFRDVLSLAFPGDACPSGWTVACTQTLAAAAAAPAATQTYCCPPGFDQCDVSQPRRYCKSLLTAPTDVYVIRATTGVSRRERVTLSVAGLTDGDSPKPITVYKPVFPLQGRAAQSTGAAAGSASGASTGSLASSTATSTGASDTGGAAAAQGGQGVNEDGGDGSTTSGGLSTGQVAGVAVGTSLALLLFIGLGVFFCLRRRRLQQQATGTARIALESDVQQLRPDTAAALAPHHSYEPNASPPQPPGSLGQYSNYHQYDDDPTTVPQTIHQLPNRHEKSTELAVESYRAEMWSPDQPAPSELDPQQAGTGQKWAAAVQTTPSYTMVQGRSELAGDQWLSPTTPRGT